MPVLKVGEERRFERLPYIDGSSCEYEIEGLQIGKWYEVKISYPASIPADFDITFTQHWRRAAHGRKLLNAEKTTFYIDRMSPPQDSEPLGHVRVVVHPTGVRSIYHPKDHEFMIYNILCEEVVLGLPKQAWWVGCLAVLMVCAAIYISGKIPPSIAPAELKNKHPRQTE